MLYFNIENRIKLQKAIVHEAVDLGVDLVMHGLDRHYDYNTKDYQSVESLIEKIVKGIRDCFSRGNISKKEMCIELHKDPLLGEFVRVQTRCKK